MEDINLGMFKPYDIRTKRENLTPAMLDRLCASAAVYYRDVVKAESIVICRDARLSAPEVAEALAAAMEKAGLDVYFNPLPVSTCQFYYSCMRLRSSGLITASVLILNEIHIP